ncbi:L10-interacting MYB domain-containing protein-like [Morus notabilis]|uniref:L10-interacting MYB domain-containing protein-like n=1 Tax=Morus notabilis TaxID=981085 RepID=UPI000CED488C|nr:L10-interacting MYB domain-containing protein-like [Morus notabilis]
MEGSTAQGKAIWDTEAIQLFCDLCIKEVEGGHRPGTHLDKVGWENVIQKFNEATKRVYKRTQLKNKWDALKNDWKLWKELVGKETGLGWNNKKNTIDASEEWWHNKLQIHPNAAKFRTQGIEPEFEDKLNRMFTNTVATGVYAWTPASGQIPCEDDKIANEMISPLEQLESSGSSDAPIRREMPQDPKKKRPIELDEGQKKFKRGKGKDKVGSAAKLSQQIERLVTVVETISTGSSIAQSKGPDYSMTRLVEVLESLPGLESGSELYFFTVHLCADTIKIESFFALKRPELQLNWLKFEHGLGSSS